MLKWFVDHKALATVYRITHFSIFHYSVEWNIIVFITQEQTQKLFSTPGSHMLFIKNHVTGFTYFLACYIFIFRSKSFTFNQNCLILIGHKQVLQS